MALAVTTVPVCLASYSIILPWKVQGTCAHEYTHVVFACLHNTCNCENTGQCTCVICVVSLSLDPPSDASRELFNRL
jgi:hypothetical protein